MRNSVLHRFVQGDILTKIFNFMFRKKWNSKKKNYILKNDDKVIRIPLTFHGKNVEINSKKLEKGEYILLAEEVEERKPRLLTAMW